MRSMPAHARRSGNSIGTATRQAMLLVNRGFAYTNGRLFRGTSDSHVLAMDPADGHVIWDRVLDVQGPGVSIPMAPIAANGLVYVGNAGGDQVNVTGHVYALDANDGHVVWKFDVVPETGPARATWTNPKYPISGGAFWTSFTLDEPNGVLYVPAGNPAPDFDSERRTGDNLYTDSVIAIDAATGRMLGYNQLVKRDSHDWDVDSPPTLATTRSGKQIVASANKDGLLSILDRSRVTRGATPADLTAVLPLLSQTPTTTRENVDVPLSRDHAVRFCPGIQGGVEWNGAAFSPDSNSLFVAAVDWCSHVQLKRDLEVPASGGLGWLGNENPMSRNVRSGGPGEGVAHGVRRGDGQCPLEVSRAASDARRRDADSRWAGVRCGSRRPDLRCGRGHREHSLAIKHGAIHRWWHYHLSRRGTTAPGRGFRNEVTDVAGRRPAKPHSRVRFTLTDAQVGVIERNVEAPISVTVRATSAFT